VGRGFARCWRHHFRSRLYIPANIHQLVQYISYNHTLTLQINATKPKSKIHTFTKYIANYSTPPYITDSFPTSNSMHNILNQSLYKPTTDCTIRWRQTTMLPASMFFEFIARNYMLYSMPAQNYRKLLHCASKLFVILWSGFQNVFWNNPLLCFNSFFPENSSKYFRTVNPFSKALLSYAINRKYQCMTKQFVLFQARC